MKKVSNFTCEFLDGEVKKRASFSILGNELLLDTVREGGTTSSGFKKWVTIYDRYFIDNPDMPKNAVHPLSAVQLQEALDKYRQTIFITVEQ